MSYIYEFLIFNGIKSLDYGVRISGGESFTKPQRSIEKVVIPGRNGTLEIDNNRYENIQIAYPAFIVDHFRPNYEDFASCMLSQKGYQRLEDTYHEDYFRMARYIGGISPNMTARNKAGKFDIVFDCKPQMFLKEGEKAKEVSTGQVIKNPTFFNALPLIRLFGTGTFTLNETLTVSSAVNFTDIDCEAQEAFKGNVNCNQNISLSSGRFPYFKPGDNEITFSGFSLVEIIPRWWTL